TLFLSATKSMDRSGFCPREVYPRSLDSESVDSRRNNAATCRSLEVRLNRLQCWCCLKTERAGSEPKLPPEASPPASLLNDRVRDGGVAVMNLGRAAYCVLPS